MPEQRCVTCGAFLMCDQCLRPIREGDRAAVLHRDGGCHALHVPDCATSSWSMGGLVARLLAVLAALLGLGWVAQADPGAVSAILRLLPR